MVSSPYRISFGGTNGVVEEMVARIPGAAFAVDQSLRIVAWNRKAEEGLGVRSFQAAGRYCYDIVPAVDVETGRPCHETCPLVHPLPRHGWAHNRVLRARWAGSRRTRLDCFLLQCLLPGFEQGTICFVGPPTVSTLEAHSQVLEAIEAIYPVVSGPADPQEALSLFVRTLMRATSAEAGELFLREPESTVLVLMEHQGLPTETVREFCRSAIGEGFPDLIARSEVPLLAVGASPDEAPPGTLCWYLCAPLVAEGQVLGAVSIASQHRNFDVAAAVRILFPVAVQISVYLRWAYLVGAGKERTAGQAPARETGRLRFYCLGPFDAVLDGETVPPARFERLKALTLLKFLVAQRGRPVPRDMLMELLWPEADPARASGNLRVVLHDLRRGLEPDKGAGSPSSFVLSQGDLIYMDPSRRVWVDVEEFMQAARRAGELAVLGQDNDALTECRKVASLYKGEFMEDEPYSDWCLFERQRIKETYLNLLKQMSWLLTKQGDVTGAIDNYRTALSVDQGREENHRELIRLLWQAGRRDEAMRQYETCRNILQTELGAEPTDETKLLYATVAAGRQTSS